MGFLANDVLIRFAGYQLDPAARVLKQEDRAVSLGPKTFDLLVFLALHPQRVVTKEELLAAVWPDSFVEESNLSQHVFLLRKALGTVGQGGQFIVTVPGKGYQFAVRVEQEPRFPLSQARGELLLHAVQSVTRIVVQEETDEDETDEVPALPAPANARKTRRRLLFASAAIALAAACAYPVWRWLHPAHGQHVSLVLSQVENNTGDSDFDSTLNEALLIDLQQSPYLNLISRSRIRETLAKMQHPADEKLTPTLAREVCERNNGEVVLRGAISQLGKTYVFMLNADSCVNGKSIAGYKADAASKEEVLAAVDEAAARLRRMLGESASSLDHFQVPIAVVTTSSLEALRAYSEGDLSFNRRDMKTAATLYQRAIQFDPNFASAYKSLAWAYSNDSQSARAAEQARKAFDLRTRTSERERLNIETTYYYLGTGDLEAAARSIRLYLDIYPDSAGNWGNLCNVYTELGQYNSAIAAGESALRVDPNSSFAADALARAYLRANRFADASRVAHASMAAGWSTHSTLFQIAFARQDAANIQTEGGWGLAHQNARLALDDLAFAAAASGKMREAKDDFLRSHAEALREGNTEFADQALLNLAAVQIEFGKPADAKETLKQLQSDSTSQAAGQSSTGGSNAGESAFLQAQLSNAAPAQRFIATAESGDSAHDTILVCCRLPLLRALLALNAHKPAEAVELLEPARPYQLRNFEVPWLRAQAETEAGMPDAAIADYRLILDNQGVDPISPLYPLSHLRLARILALEKKTDEARAEYRAFLDPWKDADPSLPLLADAQRESAQLR